MWLTFILFFRKAIVKDAVKQAIWFLACWFFKHDIRTCCEKLWQNKIFVWISAVFHSFCFFLTLTSFVLMDFQKFSSFFQVVGLSTSRDDKFLQNTHTHTKCDFMWLSMEKFSGFIMKFFKKHRKVQLLFYPISTVFIVFFFQVYFGGKMWLNLAL